MATSDFRIGVVGVGRMGANIARHLKDDGFTVTSVYDVRSDAASELARGTRVRGIRNVGGRHLGGGPDHYGRYRRRRDACGFFNRRR